MKYSHICLCLFLVFSGSFLQADSPIYTGLFGKTALGGYDAVSYYSEDNQPVKGSKRHKLTWRSATWLFASEENKMSFEADPEAFAPQFGGYCAWAVAQGKLAKGDPKVFTVLDGKLYLNYNRDIDQAWQENRAAFIETANETYPKLVDLKE
ncbi:MAG: hypothetical protein MK080_03920 [Opitutales bacterium]|nr:hypothetical protein [Opitutales bacterium]